MMERANLIPEPNANPPRLEAQVRSSEPSQTTGEVGLFLVLQKTDHMLHTWQGITGGEAELPGGDQCERQLVAMWGRDGQGSHADGEGAGASCPHDILAM